MILKVNNKVFRSFTEFTITQTFNAVASIFTIVSNKELFDYILDYPDCKIFDNDNNLILTGTILAPTLISSPKPEIITYNGYSLPGVIEDCSFPIDSYPLQFDNLNLGDITEKLLNPFNLVFNFTANVADDINKKYEKITVEPTQTIKELLNTLASQRNIYLSNNELGQLIYTRYEKETFAPVAFIKDGGAGFVKANLSINSQALHSDITIVKQASKSNPDAAETTIKNPYVKKYRPVTKVMTAGDNFDIELAARNALSAELRNITFIVETTKYVPAGTTIELTAPDIKLNKSTILFVEKVIIKNDVNDKDKFVLNCVLPDVYTNTPVKNVFS